MKTVTVTKKKLILWFILIMWLLVLAGVFTITLVQSNAEAKRRVPIYGVEREDQKIAITFDCAWGDETTKQVLDTLQKYNAPATFFIVGDFAERYPESVLAIKNAGHELGNHSMRHIDPTTQSAEELTADIRECNELIKKITGEAPVLYRAPAGVYDNTILETVISMGMRTVQWNVDSLDWKDPAAEKITEKVLKKTGSGSILLFHLGKENTARALEPILQGLIKAGFEPVTVSDLLLQGNTGIRSDGTQVLL